MESVRLCIVVLVTISITEVLAKSLDNPWENSEIQSRVKRVISGKEVMQGQWPWLVHLEAEVSYTTGSRKWYCLWLCGQKTHKKTVQCGGSIISNRWVLTAAHCTDDEDSRFREELEESKAFHVTYGEIDVGCSFIDYIRHLFARFITRNHEDRCHIHNKRVVRHPDYRRGAASYWNYDFALLEVEADLLDEKKAGTIDLPPLNTTEAWPADGEIGHTHGWGCTEVGGRTSGTARNADLRIRSNSYCRSVFGTRYEIATHICAGGMGSSVCNGDSGGPLVVKGNDDNYYQAGVVSFFVQSQPSTRPSGFARVSAARQWIKEVTGV